MSVTLINFIEARNRETRAEFADESDNEPPK
jgi:hypothetical protein